ncbi:hypothetical protein Tco_1023454 [Tanacetum coccineum]
MFAQHRSTVPWWSSNSPGLSTGSFAAATIGEDIASMFSQTNRSGKCRLFLLIQSFLLTSALLPLVDPT